MSILRSIQKKIRSLRTKVKVLAKYRGEFGLTPKKPPDGLDGGSLDGTTNTQFTTPI